MKLRVSLVSLGSSQAVRFLKEEASVAAGPRRRAAQSSCLPRRVTVMSRHTCGEEQAPCHGPPGPLPHSLPVPPDPAEQKPGGVDALDVVHGGQPWSQSRAGEHSEQL